MKQNEAVFTPEQLANTLEFVVYKDLISVIADKDKTYTKQEMKKLLFNTLRKEVN